MGSTLTVTPADDDERVAVGAQLPIGAIPARVRARAVGFVYSWSRLRTIFTGFIIAAILQRFDVPGDFMFVAGATGDRGPVNRGFRTAHEPPISRGVPRGVNVEADRPV
jgi:hypothetical protein